MARRVQAITNEGDFHSYMKRSDAVIAVRDGIADWEDTCQRRLVMRHERIRVKGRLDVWTAAPLQIAENRLVGGPRFRTLQLI